MREAEAVHSSRSCQAWARVWADSEIDISRGYSFGTYPGLSGFLLIINWFPLDSLATQCHSRLITGLCYQTCAEVLALDPPATHNMATMMAPVEQREVVRCDHCSLVQF